MRFLSEKNQDALEAQGGACIVYTHFGLGFVKGDVVNTRFRSVIDRLKRKNGWFVPGFGTLLDYLRMQRTDSVITDQQRKDIELRWLRGKLLSGTS